MLGRCSRLRCTTALLLWLWFGFRLGPGEQTGLGLRFGLRLYGFRLLHRYGRRRCFRYGLWLLRWHGRRRRFRHRLGAGADPEAGGASGTDCGGWAVLLSAAGVRSGRFQLPSFPMRSSSHMISSSLRVFWLHCRSSVSSSITLRPSPAGFHVGSSAESAGRSRSSGSGLSAFSGFFFFLPDGSCDVLRMERKDFQRLHFVDHTAQQLHTGLVQLFNGILYDRQRGWRRDAQRTAHGLPACSGAAHPRNVPPRKHQ